MDVTWLKIKVSVRNSSLPREKRKIDVSRSPHLRVPLNSFWLELAHPGLGGGCGKSQQDPIMAPKVRRHEAASTGS